MTIKTFFCTFNHIAYFAHFFTSRQNDYMGRSWLLILRLQELQWTDLSAENKSRGEISQIKMNFQLIIKKYNSDVYA